MGGTWLVGGGLALLLSSVRTVRGFMGCKRAAVRGGEERVFARILGYFLAPVRRGVQIA
jgi:hypothetical protein